MAPTIILAFVAIIIAIIMTPIGYFVGKRYGRFWGWSVALLPYAILFFPFGYFV